MLTVGELLPLLFDNEAALLDVHVGAAESEQLAPTKAAERRGQHQRPVATANRIGEQEHLSDGRQLSLGCSFRTRARDRAGVDRHEPVLDCGIQDRPEESITLRHGAGSRAIAKEVRAPPSDRGRP